MYEFTLESVEDDTLLVCAKEVYPFREGGTYALRHVISYGRVYVLMQAQMLNNRYECSSKYFRPLTSVERAMKGIKV